MNDDDICRLFELGLGEFLSEQQELLEFDVNERAVSAVLAHRYVAPYFPDHAVEAEYNRVGIEREAKRLDLPEVCAGGGLKRVYPDIIVHRRGDNEQNLLIVEIKMSTNKEPRECDLAKVAAFREQLKYRIGVCVELPAGEGSAKLRPVLEWFR